MLKLHNSLTRSVDEFKPIKNKHVSIYTCGPTVYDHVHIGNLSAFIYSDTLQRLFKVLGYDIKHIMNFTDVDDKTIRRSAQEHPDEEPMAALEKSTKHYEQLFMKDMAAIGNNTSTIEYVRATESIEAMKELILKLQQAKIAYETDDGVYFSINAYKKRGQKYGHLLEITEESTGAARVNNDEYDKDNIHDFALWKKQKSGEPAWDFEFDGKDMRGRPGWHIECSAMSEAALGLPFDIHTGGVDLLFPHHENEIAQSIGARNDSKFANYFIHNEHLLVDNKKMSKSAKNFYTLKDIQAKGIMPLAFRLLVLQSHYRHPLNLTWKSLEAASSRLQHLQSVADLRFQVDQAAPAQVLSSIRETLSNALLNDLNTPEALASLSQLDIFDNQLLKADDQEDFIALFSYIDEIFGLKLLESKDITGEDKELILQRQAARGKKDFTKSDEIRDQLLKKGIELKDMSELTRWSRLPA